MSSQPLVSILINNYNYGRFLSEAIESALDQTYPHIEVIVVDDGSTDSSQDILQSYGDRIHPILKNNGGQASAFNVGFAASQGDVVCFLDADDLFFPDKVEKVVEVLTHYPDAGWCFHALKLFNFETQEKFEIQCSGESGQYDVTAHVKRGKLLGKLPFDEFATSGMCFRRTFLETILPMPEVINITSDDYIKYISFGTSPGYVFIEELALQRIHDNNAYTLRPEKRRLTARIHVLTAYWMRTNFPSLARFANNLFAVGFSRYRETGGVEPDYQALVSQYFNATPLQQKFELYARNFYYQLKS